MEGVLPALPWVVATARLKAPYLAPPVYQRPDTSFYDFPQRNGFLRTDDAAGLVWSCETIGSLASLLQSWLFFELLSAFLERPINRSDFETHGFVDINQKLVHNHFRDWKARLSRRSQRGKQRTRKSIEKIINFASRKSDVFEEAADLLGSGNEDFDRVALSIKLLISLLNSVSDDTFSAIGSRLSACWAWIPFVPGTNLYPGDKFLSQMSKGEARRYLYRQPKWHLPLPPGDEYGGRAAKRLLRLFVENGWCPYRARQLCRSYDYLMLDSLAGLKCQRAPTEDHKQCMQIGRCCAHDLIVNLASVYPFQHTTEGEHDCEFIHVPKEEITNIIKPGGIPLISMSLKDGLDIKVVRCTPYITYTAISHVWSDGLGNPESNALPRCQLSRLRDVIHQTYFPQFSPFCDDRTTWSRSVAQANWESWGSTRPGKPIFTLDQK
ncbi:MAG: hypothetical protein M1839_004209 [Geoglossum umbratile]|nr:MAG: hypothetical protein M1839_004209 [Geoglossum umbratile]